MPKLYFYDTGLACALLGIENEKQLDTYPLRGSLFENFVISELIKKRYNVGHPNNLYFWRDNKGNEIDLIIDNGNELYPVEIKAGQTITSAYFKGIEFWGRLTGNKGETVVYAGKNTQKRSSGIQVVSWGKMKV